MMVTLALLGLIGVLVAVHAICLATDIPEGTPLLFGLSVAVMAAAGVGATVFSISEDLVISSYAVLIAIAAQAVYMAEGWRRHYKLVGLVIIEYKTKG